MRERRNLRPVLLGLAVAAVGVGLSDALAWLTARSAGETRRQGARRDLLRRYLRTDADIRADVVDGVLLRVLWLDPIEVEVAVAGGHVTLTGKVDRRSTAQIAGRLVRSLDGVVGLTDELQWDFDDTTLRHRHTFDA